ncbi:uncharacterized protein LOC120354656 [Nilaparvata lugens]|uniref:uncharacterized protein LOC120354656 n=1 Tax=Nilaparvata lugens TaxID=108931 RepID=UPI00193E6101|nr:uncharacterized protein LOC120354656 [Nilaparvata lugens]
MEDKGGGGRGEPMTKEDDDKTEVIKQEVEEKEETLPCDQAGRQATTLEPVGSRPCHSSQVPPVAGAVPRGTRDGWRRWEGEMNNRRGPGDGENTDAGKNSLITGI